MASQSPGTRGDEDRRWYRHDHADRERGEPGRRQVRAESDPDDGLHKRHRERHRDSHDRWTRYGTYLRSMRWPLGLGCPAGAAFMSTPLPGTDGVALDGCCLGWLIKHGIE